MNRKNLNLESQEYWIFEQFSIPAISNLEQYGIIPIIFQIEKDTE